MTIGANLNGGSLTLGSANATVNVSGIRVNIGNNAGGLATNNGVNIATGTNFDATSYVQMGNTNLPAMFLRSNVVNINDTGLSSTGRINIGAGTNTAGSEMFLGSKTLSYNNIRGNIIHIADTGLSATGKVHIASGVNGGNATGSEIKIGDGASLTTFKGNTIVDGSTVNSGTNIFCIKQNTGSIDNATDGIRDPLTISSPSGSTTGFLSLGMGVDTTYNCAYINCAMIGQGRPLVLSPRLGNVFVGPIPAEYNANNNSYTGYTNGNLIVSGNIYCNSPIIPKYTYPITTGTGNYPFNEVTTVRENDKIGYCYYIPLTSVSPVTFNNVQTIRQVLTVPRGVYMVSYTVALNSGICTGFQGFIVTGLNFNNNTTIFPSGYNYYQSGYSQIRGYTISAPTALTGSCPVFIHDGSNHNTIAIATTFESDGGSSTGTILTSMTVVRIA